MMWASIGSFGRNQVTVLLRNDEIFPFNFDLCEKSHKYLCWLSGSLPQPIGPYLVIPHMTQLNLKLSAELENQMHRSYVCHLYSLFELKMNAMNATTTYRKYRKNFYFSIESKKIRFSRNFSDAPTAGSTCQELICYPLTRSVTK